MTTKEYLSQAYRIDMRIDSKLEQIQTLQDLATKATSTLSDVPPSGTRNVHRMEEVICKMTDLKDEISEDMAGLIDLKHEITNVIKRVKDPEQQMVLEQRYLCYIPWEQIAVGLHYSSQHTFRIHGAALKSVALELESKCD